MTVRVALSGSTLIARTVSATSNNSHFDGNAFRKISKIVNVVSNIRISYQDNYSHHSSLIDHFNLKR